VLRLVVVLMSKVESLLTTSLRLLALAVRMAPTAEAHVVCTSGRDIHRQV
jgi:hypothetical protein